jgi:dimethylhistidine N-methyltransferase
MITSGRARPPGAPSECASVIEESWTARPSVLEPANADFFAEAIAGLSATPRTLPCKFFYDERGSELFQKICDLPEYYVTRTELQILKQYGAEIASHLGAGIELIGLGTGAGTKTRILLEELREPIAYIPVDISKEQLQQSAALFHKLFPGLEILPVCADYLQPVALPTPKRKPTRKVVYFPGSTIGNFEPPIALEFLRRIRRVCEDDGGLLIGVDLQKDRQILERAYNDEQGITAQFNLNLLARANRELGADFDLDRWKHRAVYNAKAGRIEMHLISEIDQTIHIASNEFRFRAGEKIITEFSYKHSPEGFSALAAQVGFRLAHMWTDDAQLFGVFYFTAL